MGDQGIYACVANNQYGVMAVSQAKHPHVKAGDGQAFVDLAYLAGRAARHS